MVAMDSDQLDVVMLCEKPLCLFIVRAKRVIGRGLLAPG